jgi:hypothetical protein
MQVLKNLQYFTEASAIVEDPSAPLGKFVTNPVRNSDPSPSHFLAIFLSISPR